MRRRDLLKVGAIGGAAVMPMAARASPIVAPRGTGDLGIVVERATGSVLVVETTGRSILARIEGLGDMSHASAVFSRDERFAYVFGRDGGLTQIDLIEMRIRNRVIQAGNAIGGAISDDGKLIAVSNYDPGGVRVFDAATLAPLVSIPADYGGPKPSKTVGLADTPGRRFVFSLYDGGEIWLADFSGADPTKPEVTRLPGIGKLPYDGNVTSDGRHYIAGLFGEDGLTRVDLWEDEPKAQRFLAGYGRGETPLPVFKMPHLEGWALMGDRFLLPAVGRHELLAIDAREFTEIGRVATHGQPIFAVSRPDGRQAWVNFAHPLNDTVEVVDARALKVVHRLKPGPGVLHMEFTPRGHEVWVSVRDADRIDIFDSRTFAKVGELPAVKPSGIMFTARAHRIGQ
jgi:protein NirF